jgi:hypothetical protein
MICTEAAEFVSALCDREIIPPVAAQHIGTCSACQARLSDYLAMGVELRRTASLEQSAPVPARAWTRPQTSLTAFLQKGWGTMRIPRLAFAAMMGGIIALACTLAVVKVGANSNGTVVLLNAVGPDGTLWPCPLSTQDTKPACDWYGKMGSQNLAYRVRLLRRDTGRVLLAIRTRTYSKGDDLSSFTQDADPATKMTEVWFVPGEQSKIDVADVGTVTFTGEWMDHMPILISPQGPDLSPGPGEIRIVSALLLKDKTVAGDLAGLSGSINPTDDPDQALGIYMPGQGRFLLSQLPIRGAVEAYVDLGRISFEEGGHAWEFVAGAPISRANHIWVLHQPDFKIASQATFKNAKLVQTTPSEWVPGDR